MKLVEGTFADTTGWCREHMAGEVFVFELQYTPMSEVFRELNRFLWDSRHLTGARFSNRYTGSVAVDVSAWNREYPNAYFESFLYYLKDHEDELDLCLVSEYEFSPAVRRRVDKLFETGEPVRAGEPRSSRKQAVIGFSVEISPRSDGIAARSDEDI